LAGVAGFEPAVRGTKNRAPTHASLRSRYHAAIIMIRNH